MRAGAVSQEMQQTLRIVKALPLLAAHEQLHACSAHDQGDVWELALDPGIPYAVSRCCIARKMDSS